MFINQNINQSIKNISEIKSLLKRKKCFSLNIFTVNALVTSYVQLSENNYKI